MVSFVFIVLGFAGLVLGGHFLVQGAVEIAQRLRVSPLVIGLTLVGFGTSTPELVTSVQAAFAGAPGIALGNVVGSNIANILLILGLSALLRPIAIPHDALKRDGSVLIAATVLVGLVILSGTLSRGSALVLVATLAGYLLFTLKTAAAAPDLDLPQTLPAPLLSTLRILGGLGLTLISARLLVSGATDLARLLEVSESIIGLSIVAVGTSLPELVTSVVAALKRQGDVAFGNIIGSNIFNSLGILGATGVLHPLTVPAEFAQIDLWVMAGATLLMILLARLGWRIGRAEGAVMLAGYVMYCGYLVRAA